VWSTWRDVVGHPGARVDDDAVARAVVVPLCRDHDAAVGAEHGCDDDVELHGATVDRGSPRGRGRGRRMGAM
jgi:hypothetical protein